MLTTRLVCVNLCMLFMVTSVSAQDEKISEEVIVQDTEKAVNQNIERPKTGGRTDTDSRNEQEMISELSQACQTLLHDIGSYNHVLSTPSYWNSDGKMNKKGEHWTQRLSQERDAKGNPISTRRGEFADERNALISELQQEGCLTDGLDLGGPLNSGQLDSAR